MVYKIRRRFALSWTWGQNAVLLSNSLLMSGLMEYQVLEKFE